MKINQKRIIGLGGGIGAGKSVVARILRLNSIPVYDCDSEAKRLMESDPELKNRIMAIFGERAYLKTTGKLDRKFIASRIFSNEEERKKVNVAVHSAVKTDFGRFTEKSRSEIVVCESAILKSSGLDKICDEIWITDAPDLVRIERVVKRNGLSEEEIKKRIASQREESELPSSCCCNVRIINNDGESPILPVIFNLLNDGRSGEKNINKFNPIDKIDKLCLDKF